MFFEDNEAVIKMIIKGRSPTMRHVSRTHRVALDWLFDRINLDPRIQIRYIDTKHQLAATLLCDKAIEITNAKTYVFADSVLCLGSISDQPVEVWKNKIKWYLENRHLKDLNRIDEEPMEFEWKIIPGFTTLGILEEIQNIIIESQCESEQSEGRIIFMSMYNDIIWGERGNTEKCIMNSVTVANYALRFPRGHCSFLGPGSMKKWHGTYSAEPDGK